MADVSLQTIFDEARRALDAGDAEQAIGIARHILQYAPDVIEGHRLLGEAYLNAGQAEQAVAAFESVLQADPENIAAYYGLGLARQSFDGRAEAIEAFERALEIQPNLADLRGQLLRLYSETPGSAGQFRLSRAGLGRLYARGQMYGQAIDEFRAVLDNEPDRDDVRVALAETLWRDGQEDEAADWCRDAIGRQPKLHKPTLILGYLQLASGQSEGEALWRRAAAQEPTLQTAQALFDILPPVQIDEPEIPPFDERAWRDEQARLAAREPEQPAPVAVSGDDDDFFGESWLGSTGSAAAMVTPAPRTDDAGMSDDDLLASLLGFGGDDAGEVAAAGEEAAVGADIEGIDEVEPFALNETGAVEALPPSLDDVGVDEAELNSAGTVDDVKPFSFDDWNLGNEDEADQVQPQAPDPNAQPVGLDAGPTGDEDGPRPFSLADFDDDVQPFSLEEQPARREDGGDLGSVQPFSLDGWNLEGDDEPAPRPPAAADSAPDDADLGGFKPFSLDELSLDALDQDRSDFLAGPPEQGSDAQASAGDFAWEEPGWRDQQPATSGDAATEDDSIFSKLLRERQPDAPDASAAPDDADDRFFSMDDVDLRGAVEAGTGGGEQADDDFAPFSLADLGIADDEAVNKETRGSTQSVDEPVGAADDFAPFSLRDLGLGDAKAAPTATQGADEAAGSAAAAAPFAWSDLGFDDEPSPPREQAGLDEWPEARPVSAEMDADEQVDPAVGRAEPFSFADLGLDDAELTDKQVEQPASQINNVNGADEVTPFSLSDLGLDEADFAELDLGVGASPQDARPAAQQTSTGEASAADDEMTPFSLADLGLSDEELAQLGIETEAQTAAEVEADDDRREAQPGVDDEDTPFVLADLGLSDEELERFSSAPDETAGAAQPFAFDDRALEDDELAAFGAVDAVEREMQAGDMGGARDASIHDADTMPFEVPIQTPPAAEASPSSPAAAGQADAAERPQGVTAPLPELAEPSAPAPTELSRFYQQLETQPDNHALRLAIARMSEQKGDVERAIEQYKQLIKHDALLAPLTEDLEEMIAGDYDRAMLRRLHRLLGDAYMKQDRFQEAMDEYSWT